MYIFNDQKSKNLIFTKMSLPKLHIKNQQEIRLIKGHPWIYSNEIANFAELKPLENGSLVEVFVQKNKEPIAIAYFNAHQLISARILTYKTDEKIDEAFFVTKLYAAKKLREKFFDKPFYRLIHSEADGLGGLVIDRFDNVFACQISTAGMEKLQQFLIAALKKVFANCVIIFRNDVESRKFEGLPAENKIVNGEILEELSDENKSVGDQIICEENGLKFAVDVKFGQKTGWFFDQRENRDFISKLAKNCDVLDAFCYQGGFGLNAFKGGAKSVTFVDSSKEALEVAKKNISLNSFAEKNSEFINEKVFETLEKFAVDKKQFDMILLDPPAFVKSKKDLFAGLRGYEKLVRLALPLLKENGVLSLTSCSHNVSMADLISAANEAFRRSFAGTSRNARLVRCAGASSDHPLHPALKESEYLKSITFVV